MEARSHPFCIISPLEAQESISCRIYREKNEAPLWKQCELLFTGIAVKGRVSLGKLLAC